jgi:hypothetical protein
LKNNLFCAILLAAFSGNSFSASLTYEGTFTVEKEITFDKIIKKMINAPVGKYKASVETWSTLGKPGLSLELKDLKNRDGSKAFLNTVKVKGQDKGMPLIPETNGEVIYPIGKTSQPYNTTINVKTLKNMGQSVNGAEQCVHHFENQTVIYGNASPQNMPMPIYGSQDYKEHSETSITTAKIDFVSPERDGGKAYFIGTRSHSEVIRDYTGPCKLN